MSGGDDLFDAPGDAPEGDGESTPSALSAALEAQGQARLGRPKGARNRKTAEVQAYYLARGYRDPLLILAEIANADPLALAKLIGGKGAKRAALDAIRGAAGELMPYFHGKMPVKVEVEGGLLPVLAILTGSNQLDQARELDRRRALSIGSPVVEGEVNEINGLEAKE